MPEHLDLKKELLGKVDAVVSPDAVLATNTSSLPVTEIAVATSNPKRVVGMHFFNPAPVQQFVEVIRTVITADDVFEDVKALAERLGKKPVIVGDKAGFIANALLFGYLNHAVSMYESRYATREDLDAAMRFGCGYPMGPLALLDLIGLDTAYEILDTMYKQGRNRLHAPSPIIKQMVSAGLLGRKSGRGFYTYAAAGLARGRRRRADARRVARPPGCRCGRWRRWASSGRAPWRPASSRSSPRPGTPSPTSPAARRRSTACAPRSGAARAGRREGPDGPAEDADALLGRVDRRDQRARRSPTSTSSSRRSPRTWRSSRTSSATSTGSASRAPSSPRPRRRCRSSTAPRSPTRPQDVIGMHFFNPAQVMKLVEVVHTVSTSPDVTATVQDLCAKVGKVAVTCGDRSGFIVNALLFPYLNDAVRMLEANYASADDIDTAMKAGCGLPMGPFELLDVVGLDVSLAIERELYTEFREPGYAPAPLLEHLVTAGLPRPQDGARASAPTPDPASGRSMTVGNRRAGSSRAACLHSSTGR